MEELDLEVNIEVVDICLILLIKLRSSDIIYMALDKVFGLCNVLRD